MNIIVTITVHLNVLQNASKCTISKKKIQFFPHPTPIGGIPHPQIPPQSPPPFLEPPPSHISGYGPAGIDGGVVKRGRTNIDIMNIN